VLAAVSIEKAFSWVCGIARSLPGPCLWRAESAYSCTGTVFIYATFFYCEIFFL
jgi:hypothetical protein